MTDQSWWIDPSGPYVVTAPEKEDITLTTRESLFSCLQVMTEKERWAVDVASPWSFPTHPDDKRHEDGQYVFEVLEMQR